MNTIYFARYIYLESGEILLNGAVSVSGNRIVDVAPRGRIKRNRNDRVVNLGNLLLLPGFINMHTHLEECVARGSTKEPNETFTKFLQQKNRRVQETPEEVKLASMRLNVRELLAEGVTSVVDSSSSQLSLNILKEENIRSWVISEIHDNSTKIVLPQLNESDRNREKNLFMSSGIGPHALFSLTPQKQKKIINFTYENDCIWMTHLAESSEELQAFSEQSGDLFSHMTEKKEWPFKNSPHGSAHHAIRHNLIPSNGICIHCNYLNGHELTLLAAKRISVVLCNQYTQMMNHKSFPLEVALNRGVSICLGTEGVAAAGEMSLFDELFSLRMAHPHIPAREMLKWVTTNPAAALRMSEHLGSISPGKLADIIGVRFAYDTSQDLLEEMLMEDPEIQFVLIDGEEVIVNY
ncbi:amidohydrolase [Chitinispirillum alkaliphilum]|nr:amidohydrolase [Chitinispirillum alkaliphilum]